MVVPKVRTESPRVAITGAAGFIGGHLERALVEAGCTVVGHDLRPGPTHHPLDIREPMPPDLFAGIDVVVHLAALAGVAPSRRDPEGYRRTNVTGTANVLTAAVASGVRRVVVASSSSVYGECPEPAAEDRALRPLSPYAETKAAAEAEVAATTAIPERVIVRPFTVYGPGQRADMLFSRLLRGEAAELTRFVRDFTHVSEVVAGLVAATTSLALDDAVEIYNLGSGRPVSVDELLAALQALDVSPDVTWGPERPGEPTQTWADATRARQRLGVPEPVPFEDGLAQQVAAARAAP